MKIENISIDEIEGKLCVGDHDNKLAYEIIYKNSVPIELFNLFLGAKQMYLHLKYLQNQFNQNVDVLLDASTSQDIAALHYAEVLQQTTAITLKCVDEGMHVVREQLRNKKR